jgi:hypothetical protein
MTDFPDPADSYTRLRRAGWSVGSTGFHTASEPVRVVSGTNGENRIRAEGVTDTEAWQRAVEQALEVGMLGGTNKKGLDRGPWSHRR